MYPYKLNKHYDDKNQKSYKKRPTAGIFLYGDCLRPEPRDKINFIERNRVTRRKTMFRLSLLENMQISELYNIFGAILRISKDATVP